MWSHGCSGRRRARPPARLGPHFVRRRASKPARALRSLRRPPHQWGVVADVARCIVSKPGQVPPPPTGTAVWPCRPGARLSETVVAFAGAGRASTETAVAFAGENWVLLARFSLALVLPVSMVAVQGRALVMVVAMVAVQGRAVVLSVSKSPSCRVSCAKKFALRAQNTPKSAFSRLLGEFFRGNAAEGAVLGEFFRANRPGAQVLWARWRTRLAAVGVLQH